MDEQTISVVVLASNEVYSLRETICFLLSIRKEANIKEIIILLRSRDCPAANESRMIRSEDPSLIRVVIQKGKDLQEAMIEIPPLITGTHFFIIAADLQTDPTVIKNMLQTSIKNPEAIVCASKWLPDSVVQGYGFFHKICSKTVNRIAAFLIHSNGTDIFSVFKIYPLGTVLELQIEDPDLFGFVLLLRPLSRGVPYIEIPTHYKKRIENKSNARFLWLIKIAVIFLYIAMKEGRNGRK